LAKKLKTVALLARKPGLEILDALLADPRIDLKVVYTYNHLPRSESPKEKNAIGYTVTQRPEWPIFKAKCEAAGVLIWTEVGSNGFNPTNDRNAPYDLLLSCNWRQVVPDWILNAARHSVNIHRGDLPKYPGKRPVLQAVEAGEQRVAITAHKMTGVIDGGPAIAKVYADVIRAGTFAESETLTRDALEPLYAPLARFIVDIVSRETITSGV
jgi:methionyl-tRNA formyltransferase